MHGVSAYGQLTNETAFALEEQGAGLVACLSGIGGGINAKISAAKDADRRIALDGCRLRCAQKILEKAGLKDNVSIVVLDSGIKVSGKKPTKNETNEFADYVRKIVGE